MAIKNNSPELEKLLYAKCANSIPFYLKVCSFFMKKNVNFWIDLLVCECFRRSE